MLGKNQAKRRIIFLKLEKKGYIDAQVSQKLSEDYQGLIKGINGYVNYLKRKRGDGR